VDEEKKILATDTEPDSSSNDAHPGEQPVEQLHGICPYCLGVQQGLVFDFFENVMNVAGRVCTVAYAMCSCAKCGKIISTMIVGMQEAKVQPSSFRNLRRM